MPEVSQDRSAVHARILYWGIQGAGKTTNLAVLYGKLRADHRGKLRRVPTPIDPSVAYDVLPIELGESAGVRTRREGVAVPGAPAHAPTRKQLLDSVDGIVFVVDPRRDRIDANLEAFHELRQSLGAYGRALADLPLVVQYNKRDVSDDEALEELHRKLDLQGVAAFEAVAHQGTGVLQTLTTISKRVIRALRTSDPGSAPGRAAPVGGAETTGPAPLEDPIRPMATGPASSAPASQRAATAVPPTTRLDPLAPVQPGVSSLPAPRARARFTPRPEPSPETNRFGLEPTVPAYGDATEWLLEHEVPTHPDLDPVAQQAMQTFEDSWDGATGGFEARTSPPAPLRLSIHRVGEATRVDERSLRVPLVLVDEDGREASFDLSVELTPCLGPDRSR